MCASIAREATWCVDPGQFAVLQSLLGRVPGYLSNCQVGNMGPCTYICVGDSPARARINSQMKQSSLSMRTLIMVTPYSTYTCAVISQDWSFPTPCCLSPAHTGAVLMQHVYVYQCVHGICVCIDYACNVCTEICMHAHLSTTPVRSWCACGVDAVVQSMLPY